MKGPKLIRFLNSVSDAADSSRSSILFQNWTLKVRDSREGKCTLKMEYIDQVLLKKKKKSCSLICHHGLQQKIKYGWFFPNCEPKHSVLPANQLNCPKSEYGRVLMVETWSGSTTVVSVVHGSDTVL